MEKNRMKIKIRNKIILSICLCIFIVCSSIVAYALWQKSYEIENKFPLNYMGMTMTEDFNPPEEWKDTDPVTKELSFFNSGTLNVVLRVRCVETITSKDGVLLANKAGNTDIVNKQYSSSFGADWSIEAKDGWWYFNKVIKPNETVSLLESISLIAPLPSDYENMNYELSYIYEFIESDKAKVLNLWSDVSDVDLISDKISWTFK